MAEQQQEEKTARHLERLSEALDSGTQFQVRKLLNNLSAAEIGDLLESLPVAKRLAVWEMTDPELDGEVLVDVNDEVRGTLIRGSTPDELVAAVGDLDLDGVGFRPARFRPEFQKFSGEVCAGVELHVVDRLRLRPLALGLSLIATIHDLHPDRFAWRSEPYEFVSDPPALDLLTGSAEARGVIEEHRPLAPLLDQWERDVEAFDSSLDGVVLYHEEE